MTSRENIIRVAMEINQCYKYLILIFIALGGLVPQLGPLLRFSVPYFIAVMTGSLALTCSRRDFHGVLREPLSLLLGLALMFGVIPLLSYVLSLSLLSSSFDIVAGLVLLASTPSPWAVGIWTGLAGGDVALAISLLVSSLVVSVFLMPPMLAIYMGARVQLNVPHMLTNLFLMIIVPIVFIAGLKSLIRRDLERFNPVFFSVSSMAAVILGAIVGASVFHLLWQQGTVSLLPRLILTTLIQCVLSFSVSYFVSRIVFRRTMKHTIALTYSAGSRNNSLSMAIALTQLHPSAALPSVFYLISQIVTSSIVLRIFEKKVDQ